MVFSVLQDLNKLFFYELSEPSGNRERRMVKSQREWRTPRKYDLLNQTDQYTYELTEIVAAYTGSVEV